LLDFGVQRLGFTSRHDLACAPIKQLKTAGTLKLR